MNSRDTTIAGIVAALALFLSDPSTVFPDIVPATVQEIARFVAVAAVAVLGIRTRSTKDASK